MIAAVLAAGASKRFGRCKLLEPMGALTMIERVLKQLPDNAEKIVVTGLFHKELKQALSDTNLELVHNPDYEKGIGTSIRTAAMVALEWDRDLLLTLGDLPYVTADRYSSLIQPTSEWAVFSDFEGVHGAPAYFPRHQVFQLLQINDNQGAKELFSKYRTVPVPEASRDIDTPSDLNL